MGGKAKDFMEMMGSEGGKMPDMVGKLSKPSKGEMMGAQDEGLCLSQDQVVTDFLIATYCALFHIAL